MNKKQKITTGAVVAFGLFAVPSIVAHADSGIVKDTLTVENEKGDKQELKANETLHLKRENKDVYVVEVDKKEFKVDKEKILKTINHVEKSLTVTSTNMTLKSTPDVFGTTLIQLSEGEVVTRVSDTKEESGFVKVQTKQNVEGWVLKSSLKVNYKEVPVTHKAYIKDDSQKDKGFPYREEIQIVGFKENKYEIKNGDTTLLVEEKSVSFTQPAKRIPKPKPKPKPVVRTESTASNVQSPVSSSTQPESTPSPHNGSIADGLISTGSQFLGVPYVWGGTSPSGFDCSGFTQYVLAEHGISVPRVASGQATVGTTVSRGSLQKGDMVYFETYKPGPSHVGFYIGNGQFLHAGGDRVQISDMNNSYWSTRYLFAKRVF